MAPHGLNQRPHKAPMNDQNKPQPITPRGLNQRPHKAPMNDQNRSQPMAPHGLNQWPHKAPINDQNRSQPMAPRGLNQWLHIIVMKVTLPSISQEEGVKGAVILKGLSALVEI